MVPPLIGVAVNVTFVPAQICPDGKAAILTETVDGVVTVAVMVFELAGLPDTQVKLEVTLQDMVCPFVSEAFVYVELLVPTFAPFNFH